MTEATAASAQPTIGCIVHYVLTDADADAINRARPTTQAGNPAAYGHTLPATVVAVHTDGLIHVPVPPPVPVDHPMDAEHPPTDFDG